ncbi:MAG: NADH-quinone oxidoreductase subunit NuoE [Brevinematia bacterium]
MIREALVNKLNKLLSKYGKARSALLPVLQELQDEYSYLSEEIVNEVAKVFELSQTEVFSVASFYHFLNIKPKGKYVIRLCRTISCELRGKEEIQRALEAELGIKMGETTPDKKYTLDYANCMGMCDKGPAMMINNDLYANLTPSRAVDIVRSYQ